IATAAATSPSLRRSKKTSIVSVATTLRLYPRRCEGAAAPPPPPPRSPPPEAPPSAARSGRGRRVSNGPQGGHHAAEVGDRGRAHQARRPAARAAARRPAPAAAVPGRQVAD